MLAGFRLAVPDAECREITSEHVWGSRQWHSALFVARPTHEAYRFSTVGRLFPSLLIHLRSLLCEGLASFQGCELSTTAVVEDCQCASE